jgi:lipopolysaccharide transport system permease protein
LTTLTFVVIFGNIAGLSTDGTPKVLFYMLGIISWSYFSTSMVKTSTTFMSNAHIFSKVYFPRLTVPISIVISNLLSFFIQLIIFLVFYFYYLNTDNLNLGFDFKHAWLLPFLIVLMAAMGLGVGIIISSLTTKYRDLTFLVGFGVQLMMYVSPVIFPLATVSGKLKYVILANPMTPIIESMRAIWLGKGILNPYHLLWSCGFTLFVLILGTWVFNRVEKSFNDTI